MTLFYFAILLQCVVLDPTVFFLPMIVKRKLLAPCQICINLNGSKSILKNDLMGGDTFFEFLILKSLVRYNYARFWSKLKQKSIIREGGGSLCAVYQYFVRMLAF